MSDAFLVNRGSGENLTPEVHENTDLIAELMDKVIGKANPNGKYLWKKYEVVELENITVTFPNSAWSKDTTNDYMYAQMASSDVDVKELKAEHFNGAKGTTRYGNGDEVSISGNVITYKNTGGTNSYEFKVENGVFYQKGSANYNSARYAVLSLNVLGGIFKGDFIGYAVSDNETQYPDNGVHSDGVWYERTEPLDFIGMFGCTKTATDTFTLAQNTKAYGYNAMHSLGEKPKAAVLISKGKIATDEGMVCSVLAKKDISTEAYTCINIVYGSTASGGFVIETRNRELATSEITDNSIRFTSYDRSSEILVGGIEYKLITMA